METNAYSLGSDIILLSTHSSSVISLPYEYNPLIPAQNHEYIYSEHAVERMRDLLIHHPDYTPQDHETEKLQTIIDFSRKIIENSKDIDSEFVDIVNDNFWDLI